MAIMIPPSVRGAPAGERQLFEKLKADPGAKGWVVFHSLDLKKHASKIETEIDMVVVVPECGVLCIEVKGSEVRLEQGLWSFGYDNKRESPFKQASTAMHALRDYVVSSDPALSKLLFFSAVFFTRVEFDIESPEWHPWQVVAKRDFSNQPVSKLIRGLLEKAHSHVANSKTAKGWYDGHLSRPTNTQVEKLQRMIRGCFAFETNQRDEVTVAESMIVQATEEQIEILYSLQENDRFVIKGPAGTGKTFLAIEAVRYALNNGKRVAFICFNKLLADWLKQQFKDFTSDTFFVGTLHRLLLNVSELDSNTDEATTVFWKEELPDIALTKLLDGDLDDRPYDLLVVDEAQDILVERYLSVLDCLLQGGLAQGKWCLFGDFEKQAIYREDSFSENDPETLEILRHYSRDYVNFSLRKNCRNAKPISNLLTLTCDLKPGYSSVLGNMELADAMPYWFTSENKQRNILKSCIEGELRYFAHQEIVVLSCRTAIKSCAATGSLKSTSFILCEFGQTIVPRAIRYTSIHAFKGLEAPVIILTDVESIETDRMISLLYVGMSRARVRLHVLMNDSCRSQWDGLLDQGMIRRD